MYVYIDNCHVLYVFVYAITWICLIFSPKVSKQICTHVITELMHSMKKSGSTKEATGTDVVVGPYLKEEIQVVKDHIPAKPAFQEPAIQGEGKWKHCHFGKA